MIKGTHLLKRIPFSEIIKISAYVWRNLATGSDFPLGQSIVISASYLRSYEILIKKLDEFSD